MRTLLLALLIALLPLRGWMGDAMAMEPVHSATMQHTASAPHAEEPCPTHAHAMPMDDGAVDASSIDADLLAGHAPGCDDCKVCQLCHGTALSLLPTPLHLPSLARSAPQSQALNLSSVVLTPQHKPPIL
jgi:hypothetical protein